VSWKERSVILARGKPRFFRGYDEGTPSPTASCSERCLGYETKSDGRMEWEREQEPGIAPEVMDSSAGRVIVKWRGASMILGFSRESTEPGITVRDRARGDADKRTGLLRAL